jgi:hypothetical protein
MNSFFCLFVGVIVTVAANYNADLLSQFNQWQVKHVKFYRTPTEFDHAVKNFEATLIRISENNKRLAGSMEYGLTKFADLSPAEFKAMYLTRKPASAADRAAGHSSHSPKIEDFTLPKTWDWRTQHPNAVTPVKDQGQCGSCWAFSTTESVESMHILKGRPQVLLAPEQIVDCDTVDQGCNGGDLPTAFQYVTQAGGLDTSASYPYTAGITGSGGVCQFNQSNVAAKINGFTWAIPECVDACAKQDLTAVQTQLATVGPLAICVNAEPWQDYQSGVFNDPSCTFAYGDLDHCVQLVGYDNNQKYMIVRNSWNTDWGVNGYIYIATNTTAAKGNLCGILDEVAYANAV